MNRETWLRLLERAKLHSRWDLGPEPPCTPNRLPAAHVASTSSSITGQAGDVVQARDITGGIHFHAPAPAERATVESRVPRQLPNDVCTLIGRDPEIARLLSKTGPGTDHTGLLAIVGTPGVGKTALAVHLAHLLLERYPDGVLFINLHGYDARPPVAPDAALGRFLRALGVLAQAIPADLDERVTLYHELVADRRILILIDNASSLGQIHPLLPVGDGNLLIVTSRDRLTALADHNAHRETLSLLHPDHAATLITTITGGYRPPDNPDQVARLAALCANLPLALRIAAERAAARPLMPLAELIEDLTSESSLWHALTTGDEHDAEAVRTVFAWSYRTLPESAARAFRLLALHPGPDFCADVAGALLNRPAPRVRALLDALAGAHLIEQTGHNRYQFHDLLRAYAAQQVDADEKPGTRRHALSRTLQWYLHTADAAARTVQTLFPSLLTEPVPVNIHPAMFTHPDHARDWFSQERTNLLSTLNAAHDCHLDTLTWQLCWTLRPLYINTNATDDWISAATIGLDAARRLDEPETHARMLAQLAAAHRNTGALQIAADFFGQALEIFHTLGNTAGIVENANSIGLIHLERRELEQALTQFDRVLRLAGDGDLPIWAALALDNLAATEKEAGRTDIALTHATEAFRQYQLLHVDTRIAVVPLLHLARIHRESGQYSAAETYIQQAENLLESGSHLAIECDVLLERAAVDLAQARYEEAENTYWECMQLQRPLGYRLREAAILAGLGRTRNALGRDEEATGFYQQAIALQQQLPDAYHLASTLADYAHALDNLGDFPLAREQRVRATSLLNQYADPRATALSEVLNRAAQ